MDFSPYRGEEVPKKVRGKGLDMGRLGNQHNQGAWWEVPQQSVKKEKDPF